MRAISIVSLGFALIVSTCMAILLTELGQLVNVPRAWPLAAFAHREVIAAACLLALIVGVVIAKREGLLGMRGRATLAVAVTGLLLSAFYIMPYLFFPTHQHDAVYKPIADVDAYLEADEDVIDALFNETIAQRSG